MELFGYSLTSIYLAGLILFGCLTLLYVLLGDVIEAAADWLNPALLLSFFTFLSAAGYLLESLTSLNSFVIMGASVVSAGILAAMLHVFVLVPVSTAEESLAYQESDLRGRKGRVLTGIPVDGFGEILIHGISGHISKTAVSIDNQTIPEGTEVLVIEAEKGIAKVMPYEQAAKLY
ncbi:NfeD family protein [Fictibacillus aquaticus]|uniref:NfeD family protein n=2 Tax=Fictibacillus aquaticus TaxID=2021314 RepID=UPI0035EB996B